MRHLTINYIEIQICFWYCGPWLNVATCRLPLGLLVLCIRCMSDIWIISDPASACLLFLILKAPHMAEMQKDFTDQLTPLNHQWVANRCSGAAFFSSSFSQKTTDPHSGLTSWGQVKSFPVIALLLLYQAIEAIYTIHSQPEIQQSKGRQLQNSNISAEIIHNNETDTLKSHYALYKKGVTVGLNGRP